MSIFAIICAIVLAVGLVVYLHVANWIKYRFTFPIVLGLFAVTNDVFTVVTGDLQVLAQEVVISAGFLLIALLSSFTQRVSSWLIVAMGLLSLGLYSIVHDSFFINSGIPQWWPEFSAAFYVVLGGYLVLQALKQEPEQPMLFGESEKG